MKGRNLLPNDTTSKTVNGVNFTFNADGSVTASGTAGSRGAVFEYLPINTQNFTLQAGTYTLSGCPSGGGSSTYKLDINDANDVYRTDYGSGATFTLGEMTTFRRCRIVVYGGVTVSGLTFRPQLELGSIAHPYVPYGHVGLDVTADGKTTTTPIPLPSRGWVGSLPDGTHDALSIDGAGKVSWVLADAEVVLDGSETWIMQNNGKRVYIESTAYPAIGDMRPHTSLSTPAPLLSDHFVAVSANATWGGTVGMSAESNPSSGVKAIDISDGSGSMTVSGWKTWLQSNPVTVLYPLATPTTEDMGYVDLPDIPEGAVVSMPELDGLGVESWTSDAVARYVRAWAARS